MSLDLDFEFEAPQFVESWENAANIHDGADQFFDALESLTPGKTPNKGKHLNASKEVDIDKMSIFKSVTPRRTPKKVGNPEESKVIELDESGKIKTLTPRKTPKKKVDENRKIESLTPKNPPLKTPDKNGKIRLPIPRKTPKRTPKKKVTFLEAKENVNETIILSAPKKEYQIINDSKKSEHLSADDENIMERRLSLKRKASPLKDINEYAPSCFNLGRPKPFRIYNPVMQILPTIAESPVLLTKSRARPKPPPEPEPRPKLKAIRKKVLGVCVKPLPKPPTIPEPFNLTEVGKNVHNCTIEEYERSTCFIPPRKPLKKRRTEGPPCSINPYRKRDVAPFSFYERDKEIMRRKQERIISASENAERNHEFRAKEPIVLKKEPFRPELGQRELIEPVGPELSTVERSKRREERQRRKREFMKQKQLDFEAKKIQELEDNLFVFKAKPAPAPKGNSSFLSTASSSKKNFFDSSVASTISVTSSTAFSFHEKQKRMLKGKSQRMMEVEIVAPKFKAREPSVLKKDPFWPKLENRTITISSPPALVTEKRGEERKRTIEEKLRKRAEEEKKIEEEIKRIEQEEIRKIRKKMEFKATSIMK